MRSELKKPIRAYSGVTVVAVMTKPWPCPHGKCLYCFGGPPHTPQSYYGEEPALMRAVRVGYDPYLQISSRLRQYEHLGHNPSKVELIVMGGTFPSMPIDYQEWFITMCLEALNCYPQPPPSQPPSLEEAQLNNEEAAIRCVGLTIETRPDWAKEKHIDFMLRLGATKVEVGVQTVYDEILRSVKRGHTVEDVVEATRRLKDAGLKVTYHLMPGLPGSTMEMDLEAFKTVFKDHRFRPDALKIYPTLVIPGSELYEMWRKGEYKPMEVEEAIELLCKVKSMVPRWVRIMRVQRDVPAPLIAAGVRKSNLRELVARRMEALGLKCQCIRCREVGVAKVKYGLDADPDRVKLLREKYEASEGVEEFLSFEEVDRGLLIGFLRLRMPSPKAHRPEVDERTMLVRELRVYGLQVPIGEKMKDAWQHRGYGTALLREAERIAREEYDAKRLLITSAVGVRPYYRRLGYRRPLESPYMVKELH